MCSFIFRVTTVVASEVLHLVTEAVDVTNKICIPLDIFQDVLVFSLCLNERRSFIMHSPSIVFR